MRNGRAPGWLALVALLVSGALHNAPAQTVPWVTRLADPHASRFMWVGNSFFYYNNGMPDMVQHMMTGMPAGEVQPYSATLIAISGASFAWHDVEAYFNLDGLGSRRTLAAEHLDRLWDATLMMDCSDCPIAPKTRREFVEAVRKNSAISRRHGAEPILFMTWAYSDHPEMTAPIAEAYTQAGNANHALVIPAGLAFARVAAERPDLVLCQSDHRHPTLIGSYLAASTVFASVFRRSPEASSYDGGLPSDVAAYLRRTAWRTSEAFFSGAGAP